MAADVQWIEESTFWRWFCVVHLTVACLYGLMFYVIYSKAVRDGESPRTSRNMASCYISLSHSVLCTIGVTIGFFHDELYKREYRIVSPPGLMYCTTSITSIRYIH